MADQVIVGRFEIGLKRAALDFPPAMRPFKIVRPPLGSQGVVQLNPAKA